VHVVNYNMFKFGFKILKLLNLKWKIASDITGFILIAGHCTTLATPTSSCPTPAVPAYALSSALATSQEEKLNSEEQVMMTETLKVHSAQTGRAARSVAS
jgi:hypothetical protein